MRSIKQWFSDHLRDFAAARSAKLNASIRGYFEKHNWASDHQTDSVGIWIHKHADPACPCCKGRGLVRQTYANTTNEGEPICHGEGWIICDFCWKPEQKSEWIHGRRSC